VEPGSEGQCVFIQKQPEIFLHLFLNTRGIEELENNFNGDMCKRMDMPPAGKNKHNFCESG
jgi:hypothetical protein